MEIPKSALSLLFLTVLVIACKPTEETEHGSEHPPAETSGESSLEILVTELQKLEGTEWILDDLCGQAMGDDHPVTLAFSQDGRISGNSAVNRYSGPIKLEDGLLKLGPFMSTRMAGAPEAMETEIKFLEALSAAQSLRIIDGSQLMIPVQDRDQPLRFRSSE